MKLRSKLPLLLVPLVIGPLLVVSWIAVERMRANAEENMLSQMASLTGQIALSEASASNTMEANALLFSGSGLLKNYIFTPEDERYYFALLPLLNLFASYNKAYPDYEEIRVVLPDGYEDARYSANDAPNAAESEAESRWFQSMARTRAASGSFFQWNPDTGEPVLLAAQRLSFVDPTFEDSTAKAPSHRGYLVITARLDKLRNLIANTRIGKQGGILVLDDRGRPLFPDAARMRIADYTALFAAAHTAAHSDTERTFRTAAGELLLRARKLPGGLLLVSYLPARELARAGQELVRVVVFIGVFALVLAVGLLMLVLQYVIVKPLSELGDGAEAIGGGDLDTRLKVRGNDEVAHLATQFNSMAAHLSESHKLRDEAQAEALRLKEASIESLRAADRLKDEFLANTSHELRTPLHGITGIAESLLKGAAGPVADGVQKNLELVIASSRRLANLVNDILDFSKLRHKELKLAMRPVDLKIACDLVISMVRVLADPKHLELRNDVPDDLPPVLADENRLQQILYNLFGNAVKFTAQGHVAVSAKETDGLIRIQVEDTGVGISEQDRELIFESFEQLDGGLERAKPGTGLGLAITRKLVESHGGSIWSEDRAGGGSLFAFTLQPAGLGRRKDDYAPDVPAEWQDTAPDGDVPDSPVAELAAASATLGDGVPDLLPAQAGELYVAPDQAGNREHLLVVDDEPVNLRVVENHLRINGYRVSTATSGVEAQALLRERGDDYDLVLLDVMMPGLSGYQVCEELRDQYTPERLPVIFLTALTRDGDLDQGFAVGGNDYIPKPFSYDELQARIRLHLTLSRQSRALQELNQELEERVRQRTQALEQAYSDMERLASIDGLTGVSNRRALDSALHELWAECENKSRALSYLIVDIDYFKSYNDRYGHQAGDACLREVAGTLQRIAERHGGFLGRYGGEEFGMLLPLDTDKAGDAAHEARRAVSALEKTHEGASNGMLTISIGGCSRSESIDSPERLVRAADSALYIAKQSGRDRVEFKNSL